MSPRSIAVVILVALLGLAQVLGDAGAPLGGSAAYAGVIDSRREAVMVVRAHDGDDEDDDDDGDDDGDDDDGDDDDDDDDGDDDDDDDDDEDDDEEEDDDEDDEEDDDDEDDHDDEDDEPTGAGPPALPPANLSMEATGTSTGGDSEIALAGERVVIRVFPWMPRGINLKTRFVDPATVTAVPGTLAGNMVFLVEARGAAGVALPALPAEINLSVRYGYLDVAGLNEQQVTLSRLNPANNQWTTAPKLARDAESRLLAASTTELGVYAVHVP